MHVQVYIHVQAEDVYELWALKRTDVHYVPKTFPDLTNITFILFYSKFPGSAFYHAHYNIYSQQWR